MIIESQYDETTGTVTFQFDTTFAGARPVPGLTPQTSVITLTKAEAMKIPGAKIVPSPDGSTVIVKVDTNQLKKTFSNKIESGNVKPKIAKDRPISEWDKFEQERSALVSAEVRKKEAYRKTIAIDKKSLLSRESVSYDPATGVVQFNTPEDKDTDQLLARGGTLNPTYAVILPNDKYYETDKSAVAVDSIVAQEELITGLRQTNTVDKFKMQLIEKGYFNKVPGMSPTKISQSLSKKGIADENMRVALSYFLADYSTANAENILNDTATFSYDEFLTNFNPDFTEETAYVPSVDDANAEIDKAYLENVGRRATDKEKKAFFAALQTEALSKPLRQVPGFGAGPDINFAGFSEDDLAGFAEEYSLNTPASKEYAKGYGGYEAFNNALNSLISDLENDVSTLNAPIVGNRNAI
jgi:hypothetical protein